MCHLQNYYKLLSKSIIIIINSCIFNEADTCNLRIYCDENTVISLKKFCHRFKPNILIKYKHDISKSHRATDYVLRDGGLKLKHYVRRMFYLILNRYF